MSHRSTSRSDSYDQRHAHSDYYRNDRDRDRDRDKDRGLFDRGRDLGASRDRDRGNDRAAEGAERARTATAATAPKLDTSVANPRQEPHSAARRTAEDVARVLREVFETGLDRVHLKHEEQKLDSVEKQKEEDFLRTQHRHADYPHIGEAHHKFKKQQTMKRDRLKQERQRHDDKYRKLTASLAHDLVDALPAIANRKEAKISADPTQLRSMQDRIDSVSSSTDRSISQIQSIEAKQKELAEGNTSLNSQVKDLKQESSALSNSSALRMDNLETSIRNEKAARDLGIQALQNAIATFNTTLENLNTRVTSLESENTRLKEENKALLSQKDDFARLQKESQEQNAKLGDHEAALATIRQDAEARHEKAADVVNTSLSTLTSKVHQVDVSLSGLKVTVETQGATLSSLVPRNQAAAAQSRAAEQSDSPGPSQVASLSQLKNEVASLRTGLMETLPTKFGSLVDKLREKDTALENRVGTLEAAASLPKDDLAALQAQVQTLNDKYETIAIGVRSLEHQFSNITTKEVADHIIAYMESMFPNGRQLQEDIVAIGNRVEKCEYSTEEFKHLRDNPPNPEEIFALGNTEISLPALKKRRLNTSNGGNNGVVNSAVNGRHTP